MDIDGRSFNMTIGFGDGSRLNGGNFSEWVQIAEDMILVPILDRLKIFARCP